MEIKSETQRYPVTGLRVFIEKDGYQIGIPNKHLRAFGFFVGGCEAGICATKDNLDILEGEDRVNLINEIIMDAYIGLAKCPDAVTQMHWLRDYPHKTKVMQNASRKVFNFLKEEYQELLRFHNKN